MTAIFTLFETLPSVLNNRPKTNNSIEWWNRVLNSKVSTKNPPFMGFF